MPFTRDKIEGRPQEQQAANTASEENDPATGTCAGPVKAIRRYTVLTFETRGGIEAPEDPA